MHFLILHFEIFLAVYAVILLDVVLGIADAISSRTFSWKFFPEFINTMLRHSIYLMFGNAVDYFSQLSGRVTDGMGLYLIAATLISVESASIIQSIKSLPNNKLP